MSNPNLLFYFDMPAAILSAILFAALTIYYKHKTKTYYVIMVMSLLISCYSQERWSKPNQGYRYSGDEFLIISRLPEPDFRKALISLQTEIMSQKFAGVAGRVTVTVGFCSGKPLTDLDLTDMFKKADRMMYSGKRSHRYDTTDNGQDGTLSGIEAKQHNQ